MKVVLVFCAVFFSLHKISLASYLREESLGKSSIATEYEASFQQLHGDGVNASRGNLAGNHHFEQPTNEEPWESFASKCANVIHGLVTALASAISPQPGDATDLQLDIKNRIFHHDNRQFNTCKPATFLTEPGNVPSTETVTPVGLGKEQSYYYLLPENVGELQDEYLTTAYPFYPEGGQPVSDVMSYPEATTACPEILCQTDPQQSQLPEIPPVSYLPLEAYPTPEPTMNTPATREVLYTRTTPKFPQSFDSRQPIYDPQNNVNGKVIPNSEYLPQNNLLQNDGQSFAPDVLPLDNWKPYPNNQNDLIPPSIGLTDDAGTSPNLAPVPSATASPEQPWDATFDWEDFYNQHPELLNPGSLTDEPEPCATEIPQWAPNYDWDTLPDQSLVPPLSDNENPSNIIPSDNLVTALPPVTASPLQDNSWESYPKQPGYFSPVGSIGDSSLSDQGLATPIESVTPLPFQDNNWDNYGGQSETGDSNLLPDQNLVTPISSVTGKPFQDNGWPSRDDWDTYPNQQPGFVPPVSFDDASSLPGQNLANPMSPATSNPLQDNYPNPQLGDFPPYPFNDDASPPGQKLPAPDSPATSDTLQDTAWNNYPDQQQGYLPPLPNIDDSSNLPPSDNLVTAIPPVTSNPFQDNWDTYPNQRPGSLPPIPFDDDPFYGQNLATPISSVTTNPFQDTNSDSFPDRTPETGDCDETCNSPASTPQEAECPTDKCEDKPEQPAECPTDKCENDAEQSNDEPPCTECISDQEDFEDADYPEIQYPLYENEVNGNTETPLDILQQNSPQFYPPQSDNHISQSPPTDGQMLGPSKAESGQYPLGEDRPKYFVPEYVTPTHGEVPNYYNPDAGYGRPGGYLPGQDKRPPLPQNPTQPEYYGMANPNWAPNMIYNDQPGFVPTSAAPDPSAIYIPIGHEEGVELPDPHQDPDSEESCSCDDCYYEDIVDHKAFCKTACRDLEEARDELKAIFDKIKKKLKCTQRNKCFQGF